MAGYWSQRFVLTVMALALAASERRRRAALAFAAVSQALAAEIMDAYQGQGNAIRKRDEVHKTAQANKAFAHFRW